MVSGPQSRDSGDGADPGHSKAEVVMAETGADVGGGGPSWAVADRETRVRDGGARRKADVGEE